MSSCSVVIISSRVAIRLIFPRGNPQLSCPLPRESLNNISLTRGFPQYLFPFPRVTLTFCSLNRGISSGKPQQNRGKISMQVSSTQSQPANQPTDDRWGWMSWNPLVGGLAASAADVGLAWCDRTYNWSSSAENLFNTAVTIHKRLVFTSECTETAGEAQSAPPDLLAGGGLPRKGKKWRETEGREKGKEKGREEWREGGRVSGVRRQRGKINTPNFWEMVAPLHSGTGTDIDSL